MVTRLRIQLSVPASEYDTWSAEAERRGLSVEHWLRTVANFVIAAEVEGEGRASLGRRRMLSSVAITCAFCGQGLGQSRTIRKRYCSAECRVAAWRMRQRPTAGS
jgi:hypothetical protein